MTNYEKIRSMTIEEMAEFIQSGSACGACRLSEDQTCCNTRCTQGTIQYLEAEAEE